MLLDDVKDATRVSGNELDGELEGLIEAAKADLKLSGVHGDKIDDNDPLIKRAVIIYCKAFLGYEDPKYTEGFVASYTSLKHHLTLSAEYTKAVEP